MNFISRRSRPFRGSEPPISPLPHPTDMRRVHGRARAARGAAASSSRGDAFQHLARFDFATRAAGPTRDRARLLPSGSAVGTSGTRDALYRDERRERCAALDLETRRRRRAPRACPRRTPRRSRRSSRSAARTSAAGATRGLCAVVGALRDAGRDTMRRLEDFGESDAMAAGVPCASRRRGGASRARRWSSRRLRPWRLRPRRSRRERPRRASRRRRRTEEANENAGERRRRD